MSAARAEAEAVAFGDPDPGPTRAGARRRAFSVTVNLPLPAASPRVSPLSGVGRGAHMTGQLPSLHALRLLVHEDAQPFAGTVLGPLRVAYGYATWPVVAVLYLAAWILHRPSHLLVSAVVLGPAAWYFLIR